MAAAVNKTIVNALTECVYQLIAALGLVHSIGHVVPAGGEMSFLFSITAGAVITTARTTARVWRTAAHLLNHIHLGPQLWDESKAERFSPQKTAI